MTDRAEAVGRQIDILRSTGELSPAELEAIAIRLEEYEEEAAKPAPVRVLLGLGGWLAAICLMAAVQLLLQGRGLLPCGLAWLAVAVGLSRTGKSIFASQLALALALVGNVAILTGIASALGSDTRILVPPLQLLLCLILYPLLPNTAFRFLAPVSVVFLASAWIVEREAFWLFHLLVGAELVLFVALSVRRERIPAYFPLERALALLLPSTLLVFHLSLLFNQTPPSGLPLWPSGLLLSGGLLTILFHPASGLPVQPPHRKYGVSAVVLLLGVFTSPGLPAVLTLLILGKARGELYPTLLGGFFLPLFLGIYYDGLVMDLAGKAWVIAGSGLLLLWIRLWAARYRRKEIPCGR